ncbi:MAG TPA: hypothetical protein VG674_32690 [Amycolatopsis sp.]|nr:hypothetical protein [Amycolatopsis sp.]
MLQPDPYQPMPMSGADAEQEVRRGINAVRWAIAAQAAIYLALAVFVWVLAGQLDDLGEVAWPLVLVTLNASLTVALVVCGVLLHRRQAVVVKTILGIECAFAAVLLTGLIVAFATTSGSGGAAGAPVGAIVWGLLIQAVLRPLQKPELRVAFGLPVVKPRQKKRKTS